VSTATIVKPGDFASIRAPYFKSCKSVCIFVFSERVAPAT
jgi:hypothetical protein